MRSVTVVLKSSFLLLIYFCGLSSDNTISPAILIDGTKLVLTFLVHRHGDRTPVETEMLVSTDRRRLEELIRPWGYGQLTNVGRQRGYSIGKFIRRRYNELLSCTYNSSEIYIRSTDVGRTKMTVLTAMAAVYPAVGNTWSKDINWVPVPYTTVPGQYDFMDPLESCPAFAAAYLKLLTSFPPELGKYTNLLSEISEIIGIEIKNRTESYMGTYTIFIHEIGLGIKLDPRIQALMPELEQAADLAYDISYGDERYVDLGAGVLLREFFEVAELAIAGNATPRVRVYSAHDINVYGFAAIAQFTPKIGAPKFGSIVALELRRVVETGNYVVVPVFVSSPELEEQYLQIKGCGVLCDFTTFYEITSKYAINESEWKTKCQLTNNADAEAIFDKIMTSKYFI